MPGDRDDIGSGGYFDYFMVRSRRLEGPAPRTLSGVVERLRTGEKKPFGSTRELLQLMEMWGGGVPPPEEDTPNRSASVSGAQCPAGSPVPGMGSPGGGNVGGRDGEGPNPG
mgnify:FL=1